MPLALNSQAREIARTGALLDDVRVGEDGVERLYAQAESILETAINDNDGRGAAQALRATVAVLAEARNFMTLRGVLTNELGRDRTPAGLFIQIICPTAPADAMPRISFGADEPVEGDVFSTIGIIQGPV